MKPSSWICRDTVLRLHDQLQAAFGGAPGVRDEHLLDAALARPQKMLASGEVTTFFELAACYGRGILNNRPFVDGNARTGFVVAALFLELNGYRLIASELDARIHALAAAKLRESDYAAWMKARTRRA